MIGKSLQILYSLPEGEHILELGKDMAQLSPRVPNIYVFHDDNPHFKTASELDHSDVKYRNKKILFMVRNPRDVVVSNFFHQKKREVLFEGDMEDFIHRQRGSLDTILEYYRIWASRLKNVPNSLIVRYEDIHDQPQAELRRILRFIGLEAVPDEVIDEAVEYCSFNNMREMETSQEFNSDRLQPVDQRDKESYKTRRGKAGGYTDYLTEPQISFVNDRICSELAGIERYKDYVE